MLLAAFDTLNDPTTTIGILFIVSYCTVAACVIVGGQIFLMRKLGIRT